MESAVERAAVEQDVVGMAAAQLPPGQGRGARRRPRDSPTVHRGRRVRSCHVNPPEGRQLNQARTASPRATTVLTIPSDLPITSSRFKRDSMAACSAFPG